MAKIIVSGDTSGSVTLEAPAIAGTTTLTLPTTSGTIVTTGGASSLTTSGNLTFTGTGNRITGDFSNATFANRVMFQNSVASANTNLSVIPSNTTGAATLSLINAADPTNAARLLLSGNTSDCQINAGIIGTGTYLPMTFYTGGSERLRIDTSGNVGIGTSSPSVNLNVYNSTSSIIGVDGDSTVQIRPTRYSSDAASPVLQLRKARGTLASPSAVNNADQAGVLNFQSYGGTNFRAVAQILGVCETYTSDTNISGALIFSTNAGSTNVTERMRITSDGKVLIGTTSENAGGRLFNVYAASQVCGSFYRGTPNNDDEILEVRSNVTSTNALKFRVLGDGDVQNTNNSYGGISDLSLKENIVDATPKLEDLCKVKIRHYNFKDDETKTKQIGVVAQELEEVFPKLIDTDNDGLKSVKYSVFVPMLIKAMQEQQQIINDLKARIETLENK